MHGNAFHLFPRPGERGDIVEWLRPPFPRFFPPVTALPPVFYATPPHRSIRSHRSIRLEQSRDNPRKSAHRTYIHLTRKERKRREREIRPSFSYRFHYLSLFFLPPPRSPFSLYRFLLLVSRNAIQRGVFDNDNTVTRATGSRYASTSNRKW